VQRNNINRDNKDGTLAAHTRRNGSRKISRDYKTVLALNWCQTNV